MDVSYFVIVIAILRVAEGLTDGARCFPKEFGFGVATASYQIEGAWNVSGTYYRTTIQNTTNTEELKTSYRIDIVRTEIGKGESIWDRYTHTHPERVFDHTNGDTADDSYHQFRQDVAMIADLGATFYRFSISWTRILPDGFSNYINEDGIRYYNDLLSELQKHNIAPVVTMYHWDLPQTLQDLGGWTNPLIADYFEDYARVLFSYFGNYVSWWLTFNEPLTFCRDGYGGWDAPGGDASGLEDYMCAHNVLRAHARAYALYKREFQQKYHGQVGITLDFSWIEPNSTSAEDSRAAETARQFSFGWFAHPIFTKEGDYPPIMRQRVDDISRRQGYPRSRLPTFTAQEVEAIKGSYDFVGVNHYTTYAVTQGNGKVSLKPSFDDDMGVIMTQKDEWPRSNSTWLRVVPWGFRKALNWVRLTYSNPPVLITENGVSFRPGLQDTSRVQYISSYLKALHDAIVKDGCRVFGYTYWSLMDNYEWMRGFSERFGLYEVDYKSPNRTRTPRLSASFFKQIATTGCIPDYPFNLFYYVNKV